jgi:hypothetical protein
MVPLAFGRGLLSGVTVQPGGKVLEPRLGTFEIGLMGVATTTGDTNLTGGQIYFFDADGLRQDDVNDDPPSLTDLAYLDADAQARTYVDGPKPSSFVFGNGAVHSQRLVITYQGIVPGLKEISTQDSDGQRFPTPAIDLSDRVAVGDLIQILAPDPACTAEVAVSSVESDALVTADPIPAACHDRTGFTVRAAGTEPYVVEGTVDGFLGRVGPNESFTYPAPASFSAASPACPTGPAYCPVPCPPGAQAACAKASGNDYSAAYFYHPSVVQASDGSTTSLAYDPAVPALQFAFGAGDPGVQRGFQYTATLSSGFQPLAIALDTSVFPGWYLPGSVAYVQRPVEGDTSDHPDTHDWVYVAYPSAQGVLEFDPRNIVPNAANAANMVGYR